MNEPAVKGSDLADLLGFIADHPGWEMLRVSTPSRAVGDPCGCGWVHREYTGEVRVVLRWRVGSERRTT